MDAVALGDTPSVNDVVADGTFEGVIDAEKDGMHEELRDAVDDGDAPRDSELVRDSVDEGEAPDDSDAVALGTRDDEREAVTEDVKAELGVVDGDAPNVSDGVGNTL